MSHDRVDLESMAATELIKCARAFLDKRTSFLQMAIGGTVVNIKISDVLAEVTRRLDAMVGIVEELREIKNIFN